VSRYNDHTHSFHDAYGHVSGHFDPFSMSFHDGMGHMIGSAHPTTPAEIHDHYSAVRAHLLDQIL